MREVIIAVCITIGVMLFFLGCGDTIIYNVELNECSCVQQQKDVIISCENNETLIIKNAKCEKKENN